MSMSKSRGPKSVTEIRQLDDALSLDDLDKVVGGSDALPRREEEYYSPSGEGGYTPPPPPHVVVHAPADLPPPLAAIEAHVANDSWTGQQAVHEITTLIGQGDHSMQGIAGAEIATIIGRGEMTAADAMTEIHNAVTTSHSLTAEQAVGLLSGIMVGQCTTEGIDPSVGDAARAEILSLVSGNHITADHAITALAAAAGGAPIYAQSEALSPIATLATDNHIPAAQIVDDMSAAFDAHLITGPKLAEVLLLLGASSVDAQMAGAVGTEIGQLVADHKVTATEVMAGMHDLYGAGWMSWMMAAPILGAAVDANGDLAAAAGAEYGSMVNTSDSYGQTLAATQIRNLVTSHVLSADEAITMLAGMAEAGHATAASTAIINLYVNNHLSVAQVMTDIQAAVTVNALNGGHAVEMLLALGSDGGYGASFTTAVSGAMSTLVTSGEVSAQEAVDVVSGRVTSAAQYLAYGDYYQYAFAKALGALMSVASSDAPGMDAAVTVSLLHLLESGSVSASKLVSTLASQMGVGNTAEAIGEQIVALVAAHALTADEAVTALTMGTNVSMAPKQQIADAIADLIASGQVTAAQAMADIAAARYDLGGGEYSAVNLMALVAGQNPALIAAAATGITSMLNEWYTAESAIYAVHNAITLDRMPIDQGVALLTAMVGDGHTGVPASVVGTEIGQLITQNKIAATQAMADVHTAIVGHTLGVDAAIALLANAASGANPTTQMAINAEMSSLVSSALTTAGHMAEMLHALAADATGNAALLSAINALLGVVGSADPSTGIFSSLTTTTNLTTLNGAADQLYAMIHGGQTSAQSVMDAIDHALSATPPTLTNAQAISLLIGMGGHDDLLLQAAAGEELAKVFAASGPITNMSWAGLKNTFGEALNAGTIANQEVVGMLIAAIGAPGTTDGVRSTAQTVLGHIIAGDWQGTYLYRAPMPYATLASTIDTMLGAHVLTGPEAIRVAFVMTGDYRLESFANNEILSLINSGRVTGAEIHTAITSGWWRVDAAVMTLAGISENAAALGEIGTLVADGTITASRLISALHSAWTPNPDYMPPKTTSPDDVVRVLGAIAATGTADAISAVGTELISVLKSGQISGEQLNTLLAGAGTSHDAVVESVLAQLGALATNVGRADAIVMALVNAHVTTLDHALGAILTSAGINGVTNVLNLAVLYDGLSTGDANAAIVAMVGSNTISANDAITLYCKLGSTLDAGAGIQALIANGNISAGSAINAIIMSPDLTRISAMNLLTTFASSTDSTVQSAVCDGLISLNYGSSTPDQTALALLNMARENASWAPAIAGHLMYLVNNNQASVALIDAMIGYAMDHGVPVGNAMPIIAQIGAQVPEGDRAAFFGDITAMVADGRATAAQGVAALAGVAMSSDPTLQQAIGAQLRAIVAGDTTGTALHGIADAIAAHTLNGSQASALLIGMTTSWSVPAAVVAEIDALLTSNQITPAQVVSAVDNAVTAGTLTAAGAIAALANFVSENASLNQVAAREIGDLITSGKIDAQQAMFAINGTIGNPLDRNEAMALFCGMANSGQYDGGAINTAIATNIATLIFANGLQTNEAVAGIRHAVVAGTVTADQAVTLLAGLAARGAAAPETEFRGAELHDAAIAALTEVVSGALNSFNNILAAFGSDMTANMSMLTEIAGHASASFQAQFGTYIAQQVANAALTPAAAVAAVHDALVADTITPEQALTLFANMSAAVARQPGASELNGPVNAAILAMVNNFGADDDHISGRHAIEVLKALGANGGFELAGATAAEITMLLGDPRTLITSAATAGLDMNDAGAKLAAMVNAGQIGAWEAVSGIAVQSMAGGSMTGEQAVALLLSVMSHGTANGWAVDHGNPGATNWQTLGSTAFSQMEGYGVAPSVIMNGIHAAVTSFELTGQQAAILLAGLVGHADLHDAATAEIVRLLNDGGQMRLTATEAIAAIANTVSTGYANPGVLTPALAVDVLVAMSVNAAMPGDRGLMAAGLTALPGFEADQLVEAISAAIAAHSLTGAQALAILLPVATAGDGTVKGEVGHALAAMVQNHQIAVMDIRNSIRSDVVSPDTVLVVLTGMIGRADGVMAAIDDVRNSWGIATDRLIADLHGALSARTMFGEGVSANQVMAVLATLPSSFVTEITNEIGSLISQNLLSRYGAVAGLAEAAGEGTADMQRTVAAVFASMLGPYGYDATFGTTISGLVPGSMTADQAIAVFAAMSVTPATGSTAINLDNLARVGINALIASGQISAGQAMADIVGALTSGMLTADQTVGLIAGVAGSTGAAPAGVLVAAGQAFNTMFASGQISVAQAMADLDRGLMYQYMGGSVQDVYDAAGLTTTSAPALLAAIMATATDGGVVGAVSAELMTLVNSHRVSVADAMSGVHGAVTSGALTPVQALHALANIEPGSNTDMQAAIAAEMSALVSGNMISAVDAVASMAAMANTGNVAQEIAAGHAIAQLVAQGTVTVDQAIAGIRSAVDGHTLGANNALAALVGLSIGGSEALRDAAHDAIVAIVAADPTHATAAFTSLERVAAQSDAAVASSVGNALGALVGGNAISLAAAMDLVHQSFSDMAGFRVVAMLAGMAGNGDAALQAAAGDAFGDLTFAYTGMPQNGLTGITAAIAAGNMSADDAVVMLAAAIPSATPYVQLQIAGQVAALVAGGQIDAAHVMTDIHNAVAAHALSPEQALTAMAYISQAGSNDLRLAVAAETSNLVATGQMTSAEALTALITVASGGSFHLEDGTGVVNTSVTLQSLTGSMVASLIDHGQLTGAELGAAIASRVGFDDYHGAFGTQHAMALLVGISVNGAAAAQAAAGDGLAGMVQSHVTFAGEVLAMIDSAIVSQTVSPNRAVVLMMNFAAGLPGDGGTASPTYMAVASEIASLTSRGLLTGGQAFGAMLAAAINNPEAVMAAGAGIATVWTNLSSTLEPGYVPYQQITAAIEDAIRDGGLTGAEAIELMLGLGVNGRSGEAGTELAKMIQLGLVTAEQVVGTLATVTTDGPASELATAGKELFGAMPAAQAVELIGNLIEAHTISGSQGVTLLSSFAAAGGTAAQMAAGHELASLLAQGTIDAVQTMSDISRAVHNNTIHADQAVLMLTGAILNGDATVQSAASVGIVQLVAFNQITAANVFAAVHGAITSHDLTVDQALSVMVNLAASTFSSYTTSLLPAFAAEVAAQIAAGMLTAAHAVEVLIGFAGDGSRTMQVVVGQEIGTLIAGGQLTIAQALAVIGGDIASHEITVSQATVLLTAASSAANSSQVEIAIANQIGAMVTSGQITAAQAMSDILGTIGSYGPTSVTLAQALDLIVMQVNVSADMRNAGADALAHGLMDGRVDFSHLYGAVQRAVTDHSMTPDQMLGFLVAVGGYGDAAVQASIHMNIRHMVYTTDVNARLSALDAIAAVAGSGDAAMQVYVGRELAALSDLQVWLPIAQITARIELAVRNHAMDGAEAINVLAALYGNAPSGVVRAGALAEIVSLVSHGDIAAQTAMNLLAAAVDLGALTMDQTLSAFEAIYQSQNPVQLDDDITHTILDLIVAGKLTATAVIEHVQKAVHDGTMTSDAAIEMLAGLSWDGRVDMKVQVAEVIADMMLKDWGITVENPIYGAMLDGFKEVTLQMVQIGHGISAAQVIANLTQYAEAHNIPADALLVVLLHEAKGLVSLLPNGAGLPLAIATIVNDHLQAGTTQQHLAAQIVNGRFSADVAEQLLTSLATDLWSMTQHQASADLLLQAATDILHVEIVVQTVAPQVLSGEMSGTQALELLIAKVGHTAYAFDIGLMHLATMVATIPGIAADYLHPELSGATPAEIQAAELAHNRAEIAQGQILQYIADRALWGGTAAAMVEASNQGLISVGDAIAFTQETCLAGRTGDLGELVADIGLVRLLQTAPASSGLAYALHHNDSLVEKMTAGVSSLMLLDCGNATLHTDTARTLFQDHIYNTVGWPTSVAATQPRSPEAVLEAGEDSKTWYESAWWAMRSGSAVADTFGHATALTIDSASRFSTGTLIAAGAAQAIGGTLGFPFAGALVLGGSLSHETLDGWVTFGATLATQGIPGVSALAGMPTIQGMLINHVVNTAAGETVSLGLEVPAWAMEAMGQYAPEFLDDAATVNVSPALAFTAISMTATFLPMLLQMEAVSAVLGGGSDMISGACGMVSAACRLVTGTITGTVVTAGLGAFHALESAANTFQDLGELIGGVGSVEDLSHTAQSLGENLFSVLYAGTDVHAVIEAGVDTAHLMVNLFTGNTQQLAGDALQMGESLMNIVTSNQYVQMLGGKLDEFANAVQNAGEMYLDGCEQLARSDFGQAVNSFNVWLFTDRSTDGWNEAIDDWMYREIGNPLNTVIDYLNPF